MKKTTLLHLFLSGVTLVAPLVPISALATAGDLYEEDLGSGTIFKFTPTGTKSTFASGLSSPVGLAFDGNGNLFVADFGSGTIFKFSAAGIKSTFASGLSNPGGLAIDSSGNLLEADQGSDTIFKFSPDGTKSTFASGLSGPAGLAFDGSGNLFEANNTSGTIFKFTPDGTKSTFVSGLSQPTLIAFEPVPQKLLNVSARGFVQTGENVLIGGFILGGNALVNNVVVVRAIGPSLSHFGIANALQDPTVELHDASGAIIASNDNWQDTQGAQIMASGLAPTDPHESAIFATLPAGAYTAIVRGVGDTTGVALIEVYSAQ
jgi:hypothetical protein